MCPYFIFIYRQGRDKERERDLIFHWFTIHSKHILWKPVDNLSFLTCLVQLCEINEKLATNSKWNNNPKQRVLPKLNLFVESQNNAKFLFPNFILFKPHGHYTEIPSSCIFSPLYTSLITYLTQKKIHQSILR